MTILPDYLEQGLDIVFCGTAVATDSAEAGHYYAGRGNQFWPLLHEARFTPVALTPGDDYRVIEYGLGLTDLAKNIAASDDRALGEHYDIAGFIERIVEHKPRWVAFNGKAAAREVSKELKERRRLCLGEQRWTVASASAFVLPSTSASHCNPAFLEGAASKLEWFCGLAALTGRART